MGDIQKLDINGVSYDIKALSVIDTGEEGSLKYWTGLSTDYALINPKDNKTFYTCTDTGELFLGDIAIRESSPAPLRNIGEIVTSTIPLIDAGLHLLDGSVLQGDGSYTDFVDYIATLYGDGTNIPSYFCTEAEW